MERDNLIARLSLDFALRIVKLRKYLSETKNEYILSKQILRSGTSIGANIYESEHAQSKDDFLAKLYISLKEANETKYWLELLHLSDYIDDSHWFPEEVLVLHIPDKGNNSICTMPLFLLPEYCFHMPDSMTIRSMIRTAFWIRFLQFSKLNMSVRLFLLLLLSLLLQHLLL